MFVNIDKMIDDENNLQTASTFDRSQENEITYKAIKKCLQNDNMFVVVKTNMVKDFIANAMKNHFDASYEDIEKIIKTQYEIFKQSDIKGVINLYLDFEISKKIQDFYPNIYCKSFVYDTFLANEYENSKHSLSTEDFKDAIRTAMKFNDNENLVEVKVKSLEEEPEVYYQGEKMNIDNFTGLDYGFRYEEDNVRGKHYLNIEVDDRDGLKKLIKHL